MASNLNMICSPALIGRSAFIENHMVRLPSPAAALSFCRQHHHHIPAQRQTFTSQAVIAMDTTVLSSVHAHSPPSVESSSSELSSCRSWVR